MLAAVDRVNLEKLTFAHFFAHSIGSEEEEEATGGRKNPTPSHAGEQSMVGAEGGERDPETSPTLVAASADVEPLVTPPPDPSVDRDEGVETPESKDDEANASIGKVPTISKEDGTEMDRHPALSPPVTLPSAQEPAITQISTLTEV